MKLRSAGEMTSKDARTSRAPLPPPAAFSRTSSAEILDLGMHLSDCGSSDRSIRSEVFGGGEDSVLTSLARQRRVRARQAVAEENAIFRKSGNQQGRGVDSCDSSAGSSTMRFMPKKQQQLQAQYQHMKKQEEEVSTRLMCLQQSPEGLVEEKAWYLQTPQEMLRAEQLQDQIELLALQRARTQQQRSSQSHTPRSVASSGCGRGAPRHAAPDETDKDDASCVSSLSADSAKPGSQAATRNIISVSSATVKENEKPNYSVRALKARPRVVLPGPQSSSSSARVPTASGSPSKSTDRFAAKRRILDKRPSFLPTKTVPRPPSSPPNINKFAVSREEQGRKSAAIVSPLVAANSALLAAPTEGDIAHKFLLTREVEARISDVEEEIRQLAARQSRARSFIQSALVEAKEQASELQATQESLAGLYDEAVEVVRERACELKQAEELELELGAENGKLDMLMEQRLQYFQQLTVERLEQENTQKRSLGYDPARDADRFLRRDEGYLPSEQTVQRPAAVLEKFMRIDMLWGRLREHAREVGRKRVALMRSL